MIAAVFYEFSHLEIEIVPPQGLGFIILSAAAYLSSTWKVTCLIMGMVVTLHGAVASVFVPESPRWLLAQGKNAPVFIFIHCRRRCKKITGDLFDCDSL